MHHLFSSDLCNLYFAVARIFGNMYKYRKVTSLINEISCFTPTPAVFKLGNTDGVFMPCQKI